MKFSYRLLSVVFVGVLLTVTYFLWIRWHGKLRVAETVWTSVAYSPASSVGTDVTLKDRLSVVAPKNSKEKRSLHKTHGFPEAVSEIRTGDLLQKIANRRPVDSDSEGHTAESLYTDSEDSNLPLKVIVVPHSHNDPGWHKTVDSYFEDQTRPTLDNMLDKLQQFPNMTFIWAESVFLSMWWNTLDDTGRQTVKRLLKRGQLEIVGGGWVVPDEATTHYFALVDQLIEGHQWLQENLGMQPSNTWSLDPFGYSAFLSYLHKQSGFKNSVILRIHATMKELLQNQKSLEFMWRQSWDAQNVTDHMTLVMPYMLYNIKHSCGPDPDVCVRFDFRKIRGEVSESRAEAVHLGNVDRLSRLLLGQYRKKAKLFRHNVVLVPLGDDFRYDREIEWDQQFKNYTLLFNYMNSKKEWNVHARFGTVQDYFNEVHSAMSKFDQNDVDGHFPVLSGDFFPYTDRNDEYWTGYFTTRPFLKGVSRDLEVYLRSAEILFTLSNASPQGSVYDSAKNYQNLVLARRNLALFQHHDGITGTSRSWVAEDYEKRLTNALFVARDVIRTASEHLLTFVTQGSPVSAKVLEPLSVRMLSPSEHVLYTKATGVRLVVFNNVAHRRRECIHLAVNRPFLKVTDSGLLPVISQISPLWADGVNVRKDLYTLSFIVDLPPLAMVSYDVSVSESTDVLRSKVANVTTFNSTRSSSKRQLAVSNGILNLTFSHRYGLLSSVTLMKSNYTARVDLRFMLYTSRRSGAYIFAPIGPALEFINKGATVFHVVEGPVFTEVRVALPFVTHSARLINCECLLGETVELTNIVDVSNFDEKEVIMRFLTDVDSKRKFFTDQNGFYTVQRRRLDGFPREANYYPATSVVFVEDDRSRVSLIMSQPFGVSSQLDGSLEVMLDRRLQYDDNRGMGEGVVDNRPVFSRFYLLVEKSVAGIDSQSAGTVPLPSMLAHLLIDHLRNQPVILRVSATVRGRRMNLLTMHTALSCDTVLVNFRTFSNQTKSAALLVHRAATGDTFSTGNEGIDWDCDAQPTSLVPSELFSNLQITNLYETSISLLYVKKMLQVDQPLTLKDMHLHCFRIDFDRTQ
jgi:alpha-mannosidase II